MRFQLVDVMSLLWEFGRAKFVLKEGLVILVKRKQLLLVCID